MNEKDIKAIKTEIDRLIKEISASREEPSQEFLDLIEEISDNLIILKDRKEEKTSRELANKLDKLIQITAEGGHISTETAKTIVSAIKGIKIETPAPKVNVEPPKVVVNVPKIEIPSIKVPQVNVPQTKVDFPKSMELKKPFWLSKVLSFEPIISQLKAIKDVIVGFNLPRDAKDAIAVRLSDGEKFYRAIGGLAASVTGAFPFKKSTGDDQAALVDDEGNVQVDILTSVLPTNAATSAKQDDILTELGQKTEPADTQKVQEQNPLDISSLATSAKQLLDGHEVEVNNLPSDYPLPTAQVSTLTPPTAIDINAIATLYNGTKTVSTGTAEAIASTQVIHSVTIKALSTNTVAVYIGATGVTTTSGFELLAGESVSLDITNLATVFCISGSASQVIRYIAI